MILPFRQREILGRKFSVSKWKTVPSCLRKSLTNNSSRVLRVGCDLFDIQEPNTLGLISSRHCRNYDWSGDFSIICISPSNPTSSIFVLSKRIYLWSHIYRDSSVHSIFSMTDVAGHFYTSEILIIYTKCWLRYELVH